VRAICVLARIGYEQACHWSASLLLPI
jgi:hypothetical protein